MDRPDSTGSIHLYTTIGSYVIIVLSIVLIREELLNFRIGFVLLLLGALVSIVSALVSLRCLLNGRCRSNGSTSLNWINLALGAVPFAILLTKIIAASQYPILHDVTTDNVNPPPLSTAMLLREATDHTTAYDPSIWSLQEQAYPQIEPLMSSLPVPEVAQRVRGFMQENDWKIVSSAQENHLIEAIVTSPMFKFKDDIVVRLTEEADGTRVDVRSASRVGKSDLGANAARVSALLNHLR
ncbi:DUF1499 domain-containing protein [Hahella ganghwensis]|uniref:DUF1499 domain-containing protein n=1 Tax=Hahella ganghwensis TaxID=286420 RepID=UPI00036A6B97|nr:DUF1499 domain-containing protein [Hahella ganghwensis]